MTVAEVRSRYLAFFEKRGHKVIPSAPIVPENDPTTLFTSSGMQPLVPYLMGQPHPAGARIADSQLAIRTGDIEEVGDNRHLTFFEMLGNWSLGDYFKQEQLPWIFEFLTSKQEGLGFDPRRLYVSVFAGDAESGMKADTEAVEIWKRLFSEKGVDTTFVELGTEENGGEKGMQGGRIFSYGNKNWWSRAGVPANMPAGEIGGPDSEVFYDFGTPHDTKFGAKCHPNCDCGRFVEICNSVFMQFIKNADGTFSELPKRNVDFGGGLERLTATTLETSDLYLTDVFEEARNAIERKATFFAETSEGIEQKTKVYGSTEEITKAYRVVLDHIRAAVFMIAGGVRPSSTEQGYILRRLIRRAVRFGDTLGLTQGMDSINSDLLFIAESFAKAYMSEYPALAHELNAILKEIGDEEKQFRKTLKNGLKKFEKLIRTKSGMISTPELKKEFEEMPFHQEMFSPDVFELITADGFPKELVEEETKSRGIIVHWDEVENLLDQHRALSRAGAAQKFAGGLADHAEQTVRYHTAHHLLLKALQMVLGPEVHQRGSNITSERLRIDFSWGVKMTPEQKAEVEKIVNEKIAEAIPVIRTDMPKEQAEKLGAEHEFGATYPDTVSVYSVGSLDNAFSIEFCGGPHVANTSELGDGGKKFKIQKEEASSAGVRRIKAVLE